MDPIRILIVDDHPLFRQGLVDVIEMDERLQVVAQAATGDDAYELALEERPDIILMDVNLPNANGLQVTRRILNGLPDTRIVILTGYDDAEQVYHALRLGATAYCAKDVPPEALLRMIHAVHGGGYHVNGQPMTREEMTAWVEQGTQRYGIFPSDEQSEVLTPLSPREMEILELVARGASNKDIASRLGISQQTVKNHMTAILRKLRVDDRTQAAVYALRHGWVRLDAAVR